MPLLSFIVSLCTCSVPLVSLIFLKSSAEYIMLNAGLDESQAGFKFPWRSISNLRYVDHATLIAESEVRK